MIFLLGAAPLLLYKIRLFAKKKLVTIPSMLSIFLYVLSIYELGLSSASSNLNLLLTFSFVAIGYLFVSVIEKRTLNESVFQLILGHVGLVAYAKDYLVPLDFLLLIWAINFRFTPKTSLAKLSNLSIPLIYFILKLLGETFYHGAQRFNNIALVNPNHQIYYFTVFLICSAFFIGLIALKQSLENLEKVGTLENFTSSVFSFLFLFVFKTELTSFVYYLDWILVLSLCLFVVFCKNGFVRFVLPLIVFGLLSLSDSSQAILLSLLLLPKVRLAIEEQINKNNNLKNLPFFIVAIAMPVAIKASLPFLINVALLILFVGIIQNSFKGKVEGGSV